MTTDPSATRSEKPIPFPITHRGMDLGLVLLKEFIDRHLASDVATIERATWIRARVHSLHGRTPTLTGCMNVLVAAADEAGRVAYPNHRDGTEVLDDLLQCGEGLPRETDLLLRLIGALRADPDCESVYLRRFSDEDANVLAAAIVTRWARVTERTIDQCLAVLWDQVFMHDRHDDWL